MHLLESLGELYRQLSGIWKTLTEMMDKGVSSADLNKIIGLEVRELHLLIDMSVSFQEEL